MSTATAIAVAAVIAAMLVGLAAIWLSSAWRSARMVCLLLGVSLVIDVGTLFAPDAFWTPRIGVLKESMAAMCVAGYALEIVLGYPSRAKRAGLRLLLVVSIFTLCYIAIGWPTHARATYRAIGLGYIGAAGALAVVLIVGFYYGLHFNSFTMRAVVLLLVCCLIQAIAVAPFESSLAIARPAQLVAGWAYVLALLGIANAGWRL